MPRFPLILLVSVVQAAVTVPGPFAPAAAPPGLSVELRTVGNRTTFRLSDVIPLEVVFRATVPNTYRIELADGWSGIPAADRFLIKPSAGVIDRSPWLIGYACCRSHRPFLESTASVYSYDLTDFIRFTQPGEYRVQYVTRRVFTPRAPDDVAEADVTSDLIVRSEVLTLTVIGDDPEWLESTLRAVVKEAEPPPTMTMSDLVPLPPESLLRAPLRAEVARYQDAMRRLRQLDTPKAIRERVAHLRVPSVDDWRSTEAHGDGYRGINHSLTLSSRPDLVAAALEERAAAPEFAVMRGYAELWRLVVMERDHPELFYLRPDGTDPNRDTLGERRRAAGRQIVGALRELNARKSGAALEITTATIRSIERDLAR